MLLLVLPRAGEEAKHGSAELGHAAMAAAFPELMGCHARSIAQRWLLLKRFNVSSVVLVGGLTNLWNLAFFCTLVWSALHRDAARLFNLG